MGFDQNELTGEVLPVRVRRNESHQPRNQLRNGFRVIPDLKSNYASKFGRRIAYYISEIPVKGEKNSIKFMSLGYHDRIR